MGIVSPKDLLISFIGKFGRKRFGPYTSFAGVNFTQHRRVFNNLAALGFALDCKNKFMADRGGWPESTFNEPQKIAADSV